MTLEALKAHAVALEAEAQGTATHSNETAIIAIEARKKAAQLRNAVNHLKAAILEIEGKTDE